MTELLPNFAAGRWQHGTGPGTALWDPVLGTALVRVDAAGLDLAEAFAFARDIGGAALRAATYRERAAMLAAVVKVLFCSTAMENVSWNVTRQTPKTLLVVTW